MTHNPFLFLAAWMVAFAAPLAAQSPVPEDPAHAELRALKTALVEAIERGDIDSLLRHVDPQVVVTWQNGEVCRGPAELRAFFERMASGSGRTWQGFIKPPTPDALTVLYADGATGVVTGDNIGRYHLLGRDIELPNRWTATVVRKDGRWLLASYHISMNVLDNPLLNGIRRGAYAAGIGGVVLGGLAGWLIGRWRRRTGSA